MSVIPDKKDYRNVEADSVGAVIGELVRKGYYLASHVSPTDKSHFDRYGLVYNNKRVVIVYDVKAKMLSVTAFEEQFKEICSVCDAFARTQSNVNNSVKNDKNKSLRRDVKEKTPSQPENRTKQESVSFDGKLPRANNSKCSGLKNGDKTAVGKDGGVKNSAVQSADKSREASAIMQNSQKGESVNAKKQGENKSVTKAQASPQNKPADKPNITAKTAQNPATPAAQNSQKGESVNAKKQGENKSVTKAQASTQNKPADKPNATAKTAQNPATPAAQNSQKGESVNAKKQGENKSVTKAQASPQNKPADKPNITAKTAQKAATPAAQNSQKGESVNAKKQGENKSVTKAQASTQNKPADKPNITAKTAQNPATPAAQNGRKSLQADKAADKSEQSTDAVTKNDFSLKKYTAERFDAAVASLKENKIKIKLKSRQGSGSLRVDVYEVSQNGSKLTVCYMPDKKILQIQGKATDFSRRIQTLFSEGGDYKSAVNAHIAQKQTDESSSTVEKRLKKYLPTGGMYLSPQAKIDFSIGIVDLLSGNIVLSDYSSLLIPPYRGLEKLIFDLEHAQGIKVKMIGQAYEKDEHGEYVLKAVYRRKIGSIVYAEVMAALYTEYNSTRNFYVHSAPGAQTKVINDKKQAVSIYENMLSVVEYNARKLREIGFTLKV